LQQLNVLLVAKRQTCGIALKTIVIAFADASVSFSDFDFG
jgi:hypothetical protein